MSAPKRFASGGVIAGSPVGVRVLVSAGRISFDGPRGPWVKVLSAAEVARLAAERLPAIQENVKNLHNQECAQ